MFGGIGFLMNGNMLTGVYRDYLILRLNEKDFEEITNDPLFKPFDITGKAMKGWAMLPGDRLTPEKYEYWILKARQFVSSLPSK